MDRNTIIGLVLIGGILSVFTIFNQPSPEEQKKQRQEQQAKEKEKEKSSQKTVEAKDAKAVKSEASEKEVAAQAPVQVAKETIRLENDKMIVEISNQGGQLESVYLKEYESYRNFAKNDNKITPLKLFGENDTRNSFIFKSKGKAVETRDLAFTVSKKGNRSAELIADLGNGEQIVYNYSLSEKNYDLSYDVEFKNLSNEIRNGVQLDWYTAFKKSERLFSEQRRVSTVCYNTEKDGFDYLSENANDDEKFENNVNWIAYKQSYFSSILQPERPFLAKGSSVKVHTYGENEKRINTHLKDYNSLVTVDLPKSNNSSISFNWFFGPNDYETLKAYGEGYDNILNYGWGLFRWINLYAVQPVFNFLVEMGLSLGIAILLLTLVIKLVLTPIQWKMYTSSAKMRILKPEIDELNAKYPKKEDAMKKQMEMMTLYRESGASPLAGCVPMLIQMPILLAVFRFFPASFELRQKGFLWAEDLSSYDSILDIGTYIWPYGDHISLFTLLMAGTTLIYTHLNSGNMQQPQQPGMPNMKVIMYIMPIMMIFFFNNYSSGLSYYYFISTLISILTMILIKNFFVDEDKLKAKMAAKKETAGKKGKSKSKFQERLEMAQKMQQERLKKK